MVSKAAGFEQGEKMNSGDLDFSGIFDENFHCIFF